MQQEKMIIICHKHRRDLTHQYHTISIFIYLDVWLHIVMYLKAIKGSDEVNTTEQ
jgi:hypothetical protein